MIRGGLVIVLMVLLGGCHSPTPHPRDVNDQAMFGPSSMRVHPTFTRIKDWSGDGKPDGVEALVELQDQFGEPTRASGKVIFELFAYRPNFPDPRGARLVNPWIASLATLEDQNARWNKALRAYDFQLGTDQIKPDKAYVLTATFELSNGRLFDRLILEPTRQDAHVGKRQRAGERVHTR